MFRLTAEIPGEPLRRAHDSPSAVVWNIMAFQVAIEPPATGRSPVDRNMVMFQMQAEGANPIPKVPMRR